uniref:Uncharacterized protein n=1 Tax=Sipha flava TaxID=143950 RepID=A0A2S2Q3K3_9HEMI
MFDSLHNANNCPNSPWLSDNGFIATIPNSLIYSLGVIRLDPCVPDEDLREGLECRYKVVEFHRINIKRDKQWFPQNSSDLNFYHLNSVSLVFAEIVFDEAGSYGFRADNIRRNSESILTHICLMAGGHSVKAPIHDQFAQAF